MALPAGAQTARPRLTLALLMIRHLVPLKVANGAHTQLALAVGATLPVVVPLTILPPALPKGANGVPALMVADGALLRLRKLAPVPIQLRLRLLLQSIFLGLILKKIAKNIWANGVLVPAVIIPIALALAIWPIWPVGNRQNQDICLVGIIHRCPLARSALLCLVQK